VSLQEKWRMKVHIVRAERDGAAAAAVEVDEEELQIEEVRLFKPHSNLPDCKRHPQLYEHS
jgi:hypothetical protein